MAGSQQSLSGARQSSYGATGHGSSFGRGTEFEDLSRKISNLVFKINNNATSLDRLSKKTGTKDDGPQHREKLHDLQHKTNSIVTEVKELIKELHQQSQRGERTQRLQVDRLKRSFTDALGRYGEIQRRVSDQVRAIQTHERTQSFNQEPDMFSEEAGLLEQEQRRVQLQQQQDLVEEDLAIAREREERIRQLESDVLDVNEIFKELGTMVHEQGDMVDTIENNVVTAADYVEQGNEQLDKAVTYQKSYRKKLCCLAVILLVVAGVIALILGLTLKSSGKK